MTQSSFIEAYQLQKSVLNDFALHLTRDPEMAQDLLQETLYKAYKYKGSFQKGTNLKAWLMTIMRNTYINDYRKDKRRQSLAHYADQAHWVEQNNEIRFNDGEYNLLIEEILREVHRLDDWMKIPFLMHYHGFKYEEIAKEMDLPLGTVKSRIYFARQRLRKTLRSLNPGDQSEPCRA